ncbi:MAG: TonB-dependent receptor [Gammaproteobacteria bacterium]|nr:TonB-dependent receptor [Gammaproteobacteria bacterium]
MNLQAKYILIYLWLLFAAPLYADEEAELEALLALLEEETELATKTKMNADYVPGMVTVLHGDDLDALGIDTAWEALSLVSGMDIPRQSFGELITQVRNVGYTLLSGNLKILVNSEIVNNAIDGYAFAALALPVAQIKRIEVVRGPGSAIHGEYAYSGVVNIITRKQDNRIYTQLMEHARDAGGMFAWENNKLQIHGNLGAMHSDNTGLIAGPDGFARDNAGYSPGPMDDREERRFALLGLEYGDISLDAQFLQRDMGGYSGGRGLPPPRGLEKSRNRTAGISLQRNWEAADNLASKLYFAWRRGESNDPQTIVTPAGAHLLNKESPPRPRPDTALFDIYAQEGAEDSRYDMESQWIWRGWQRQTWLLGLSYTHLKLEKTWTESNEIPPDRFSPEIVRRENTETDLPAGVTRNIVNLTLQDQIVLSDTLDVTAGLRYDRYSDIGGSLTPRLAGVWRFRPEHIFKLQYAEAFRPPTFSELYLGLKGVKVKRTHLKPETLKSLEFGYIYRKPRQIGRLTLFRTALHDLLERRPGPPVRGSFLNRAKISLYGAELEWEQRLSEHWRILTNLSYLKTHNTVTGASLAASSKWLANLIVFGQLSANTSFTARWRYVGKRAGLVTGIATPGPIAILPDLPGYHTVDLTLNHSFALVSGLNLRLGVDNLLDEEIRMLSPPDTYKDHIPQPARTWQARISYEF